MESHTRTTSLDARWLRGLVGTKVSTYELVSDDAFLESTSLGPSTEPFSATTTSGTSSALVDSPIPFISAPSVSRTWVITRKLSEREAPLTEHDVKMGRGSAMTVGKILCHLAEDPTQMAFMRIYKQIPITGTEDLDHNTLARQAVPASVCGELESFKKLQDGRCSVVPRFLGHAERTQEDDGLVPGGYIRYLVWEKVPGEPLTKEIFWGLDATTRQNIHSKVRAAYQ
jgi:hypothetical protein